MNILLLLCLLIVSTLGSKRLRSENGTKVVHAPGFTQGYVFSYTLEDLATTNTANCGDYSSVVVFKSEGYHRLYVFKLEYNTWVLHQDIQYFVSGTDKNADSGRKIRHGQVAFSEDCSHLAFGLAGSVGNYRKIYKLDENFEYALRFHISNDNPYLGWSTAVTERHGYYKVFWGQPAQGNTVDSAGRVIIYQSTDSGFTWSYQKTKYFNFISTISYGTDKTQECGASLGVYEDTIMVGCPGKDKYTDTSYFTYHQSNCVGPASDSCEGAPAGSQYYKHKCTGLSCDPICGVIFLIPLIRNECYLWNLRGGIQNTGSIQVFDLDMNNLLYEFYGEYTNEHLGMNLQCSETECTSTSNGVYNNIKSRMWDVYRDTNNAWSSIYQFETSESFNSIVSPWSFQRPGEDFFIYGALYPYFHGSKFPGALVFYEHDYVETYLYQSHYLIDTAAVDPTTRQWLDFDSTGKIQYTRSGQWKNDYYTYTEGNTRDCYPYCQPVFKVFDTGYFDDVPTPAPTVRPTNRPTGSPTVNLWTKIEEIDMSSSGDGAVPNPVVKISGDAHNLFYADKTISKSTGQVFEYLRDTSSPYTFSSFQRTLMGQNGLHHMSLAAGSQFEVNRYGNSAVIGLREASNGYIHAIKRYGSWFETYPVARVSIDDDAHTTIPVINGKGDVSCGVAASRSDLRIQCYKVNATANLMPLGNQFTIDPTEEIISDEISAILDEEGTRLLIGVPGPERVYLYKYNGAEWEFKMAESSLTITELAGQETDYGRKVFGTPDFDKIVVVTKKGLAIYYDRTVDENYSTKRFQEIANIFQNDPKTIAASADLERIYTVSFEGSDREFNPSLFTTTTTDLPQIVSQLDRIGSGPTPHDYTHVQEKQIQNVYSLDTNDNGGMLVIGCLDCVGGSNRGIVTYVVDQPNTPPPTSPPNEINVTWPDIPLNVLSMSDYYDERDSVSGSMTHVAMNPAGTCIAMVDSAVNQFFTVYNIDSSSYTLSSRGPQIAHNLDPLDPVNGVSISDDCNRVLLSKQSEFEGFEYNSTSNTWDSLYEGMELGDQLDNTTVVISADGRHYVSRDNSYRLKLVEIGSARAVGTPIPLAERLEPFGYSPDKKTVVAVSPNNKMIATVAFPASSQEYFPFYTSVVAIYEYSDILDDWFYFAPTVLTPDFGSQFVKEIKFSPDGKHFAVLWDHEIEVYKVVEGAIGAYKVFSDSDGQTHTVSSLAISNTHVALSDEIAGTKRLWNYKVPGEFMETITDGPNALSANSHIWFQQESNGGVRMALLGPKITATPGPTISPTVSPSAFPTTSPTLPQPTESPTTAEPTVSPTPRPTFDPELYIRVNTGLIDLPFGKQCAYYKDSRVSQGMAMGQKYNGLFLHHYLDYDGSVNYVTSNPHKRSSWTEDLSNDPTEVGGSNPAKVTWGDRTYTIEECQNRCNGAERCIGVVWSTEVFKCGLLHQCDTGLSLVTGHDSYLRTSFSNTTFKEAKPGKQCVDTPLDTTRLSNQLPPTPKECFEHCRPLGATHISLDQSFFCSCYDSCSEINDDFSVTYALQDEDVIAPTAFPTSSPTDPGETSSPTISPTVRPTQSPQQKQLRSPTGSPVTPNPTLSPTTRPTGSPTPKPTKTVTVAPTVKPKETIIWDLTLIELIGIISAAIAVIGILVGIWSSQGGYIFVNKTEPPPQQTYDIN